MLIDVSFLSIFSETRFGIGRKEQETNCDAHWHSLLMAQNDMFEKDQITDMTLVAEGQSLPCHKVVLASGSPYFKDAFLEANAKSEDLNNDSLELKDLKFDALKTVVEYIYSGSLLVSLDDAMDVLTVCDKLELEMGKDICEDQLHKALSRDNCVRLYRIANVKNLGAVVEKARELMVQNFSYITKSDDFVNLSYEEIMDFFRSASLAEPNRNAVFEAAVAWVKHDEENRKARFSALLETVDLTRCSSTFLKQVRKEPLMGSLECQTQLIEALASRVPDEQRDPFPYTPEEEIFICLKRILYYMIKNRKANK